MPLTLPQRWAHAWGQALDRVLLVTRGDVTVRFQGDELLETTEAIAGELASQGVGPRDRVVWEASTSGDAIVTALAIIRLGAVLVPVATFQSDLERQRVIDDVTPVIVVAEKRTGVAEQYRHRAQGRVGIVESPVHLDQAQGDHLAMIMYTSGTTGLPKGAMISHENLRAQADMIIGSWEVSPEDRLLSALPLFHVHGLVVGLMISLAAGAGVVVMERFEADGFADLMTEEAITTSYVVPTMLQRLGERGRLSALSPLRLVVSGSAALSTAMFEDVERASRQRILERYGMTETLLTVSNPLHGQRRSGTVGRAFPGVELELPEKGGEAELREKSPTVFAGYWKRPEATAEVLSDGWMRSGDIVRVDEAGYVVVCGRSKELIISGGFNVYPTEIEDLLRGRGGIEDVAVVGIASERWGEEVVAYVVGVDFAEDVVRRELEALASPYKRPQQYRRVAQLPRNALGKLQRHLITDA